MNVLDAFNSCYEGVLALIGGFGGVYEYGCHHYGDVGLSGIPLSSDHERDLVANY